MLRTLVISEVPYIDPSGRGSAVAPEARANACEQTWEVLVAKWRTIPDWREAAFAKDKPLGFWRRVAMEMHGIDLRFD